MLERIFRSETSGSLSAALQKEDRAALTADAIKLGDPARGELIFRRKALACMSCHAVGSAGPEIGPNLVAVGAAAGAEYMIESILEPNAAIAEHFENQLFQLADNSIQVGVITAKSDDEFVIRDSTQPGHEIRFLASEVKKQQPMPSLMPAGLADQLASREEFLDLIHFLAVLGKPGPFANDESPVIRKWRVAASATDDAVWTPAYSLVSGELPASDFPTGDAVFARGFVNVLSAGAVSIQTNEGSGLRLRIDGQEISDLSGPIDLETGRRVFTFEIDRSKRGETGLRVELNSAPGSKAKVQPEGGL